MLRFFQRAFTKGPSFLLRPPRPSRNEQRIIKKGDMLPFSALQDGNAIYQLGFAKKAGIPLPHFPISHSALCFYNKQNGQYIVLGRQSPFGLSIKDWDGTTRISDERNYLADGYDFSALMTDATFSKQEITDIITKANTHINGKQLCDMVRSNCYSNSLYMMAVALEQMVTREVPPPRDEIDSVMDVISKAALDHFSIGVANNPIVMKKLQDAFTKAHQLYDRKEKELPGDDNQFSCNKI